MFFCLRFNIGGSGKNFTCVPMWVEIAQGGGMGRV
jgi:hypothetical protein